VGDLWKGGENRLAIDPFQFYEYRAALHVHTRYSDGSESLDKIVKWAHQRGLDILWVTDHNVLGEVPGYREHVLCLVGEEITPPTNHYLAFGIRKPIGPEGPLADIIRNVAGQHGVGFIAHPDDPGNPLLGLPAYHWTDRTVTGFTGLEVMNHLSRCSEIIPDGLALLRWGWRLNRAVDTAPLKTLQLWDTLGQQRRVVGMGGVDAHGIQWRTRWGSWPILSYSVSLATVRTHFYITRPLNGRDWYRDEQLLVAALRQGTVAIVNGLEGSERGFRFGGRHPNGNVVPMGGEVLWEPGWSLWGLSPVVADWEVWHNGVRVNRVRTTILTMPVAAPGVWRVVLRKAGRRAVWIYSNPVYFRSEPNPTEDSTAPA